MISCQDDSDVVMCSLGIMAVVVSPVNIYRQGTLDRHVGSAHHPIQTILKLSSSYTDGRIVSRLERHAETFPAVRHGILHSLDVSLCIKGEETGIVAQPAEHLERGHRRTVYTAITRGFGTILHLYALADLQVVVLAVEDGKAVILVCSRITEL